jgi:hypothetical protein
MRFAMMKKNEIEELAKSIERETNATISGMSIEVRLDCGDMTTGEKRAYLRGYDRAQKNLDKPIDEKS